MVFDLGRQVFEIARPGCGQKRKEELRRFDRKDTVTCTGCGQPIKLEPTNPEELRKVQRAFDDLAKTFKDLGKRR